ncbi:cation diffusion facilitator family transporter [Candidatus Margulisiibacteriota bacterium]
MNKLKQKYGYPAAYLSSVINVVLFIFKIWVGISIGSIAIVVDAWHSLSDTFTSVLVIISFYIAGKPKDKEHPFGHGRAELIGTIVLATLLGVLGINFLKEAIQLLISGKTVQYNSYAYLIMAVTIVVKEAMAQLSFWAAKKVDSQALQADAWHHRSDALSSTVIIIGFLFNKVITGIDAILGIIVSLLILYLALKLFKKASNILLGNSIKPELKDKICGIAKNIAPDTAMHKLCMHSYGDHIEITFHLTFPDKYSLAQAHDTATKIEEKLRKDLNIETTIHIEPND